ncbi:type B DNA-directed DNA polymerase [Haloarcula salina]|uniref:DNA-directed DNA polymerase n=1 Tax=Haloarcula salina TaxID=1429914 RepID=A0AA41G121_9EURY|nr:type B DNA-directed DNA polymerase [Haloarcula salina]MBV0901428.1 type B DNA-directed DNA polymerase [Haloarcula salina]
MAFKIDVREDGVPVRWATDGEGVAATADPEYEPALYAAARNDRTRYLDWLADAVAPDPKVTAVERERRFTALGATERSPVLRLSIDRLGEVRQVGREIRQREHEAHAPGVLSLYDVDLDPQFRYCLDTGRDPTPGRDLRTLSLSLPPAALAADDLTALTVDGDSAGDDAAAVRRGVERALESCDPDVLVLSSGDIVALLADAGVDLGRRPGHRKLAGESTYASYGRVGHSPARYDVPGRVVVDRSNSFLLGHSSMAGLRYFVERAGKPLQEVARDSIGGVLTALEVRHARERDVLAPWQKRQTERWKSLDTLHAADRGGFTFQPDTGGSAGGANGDAGGSGVHEAVHELDFASLYPNIIREYNVSPETICCDCHDGAAVPELGYSVCERDGFLGDVLGPLLDDRAGWKARIAAADERASTDDLEAKADAVKWVLVSCFGYQGYRHAKFGRIETHEAINAFAREIMLTAKERLEAAGWHVVHGIVDSLWVTAAPDREQTPVREVAAAVTDEVGIELEYEGRFDWIAFCPRKRASGAALMRYFGRWADGTAASASERYKLRGIEARQRSTSPFVAAAQRDLLDAFDRGRAPEPVCDRLARHLATLRRGDVPRDDLVVTQRVSKRAGEYRRASRAKAALERAAERGFERNPGQSIEYVVVDDDRSGAERVRLAFEDGTAYDADCYADRLVRACASVLGPLGWDERRIRQYLDGTRDASLSSFGDGR